MAKNLLLCMGGMKGSGCGLRGHLGLKGGSALGRQFVSAPRQEMGGLERQQQGGKGKIRDHRCH
jgi:hypothetical protein